MNEVLNTLPENVMRIDTSLFSTLLWCSYLFLNSLDDPAFKEEGVFSQWRGGGGIRRQKKGEGRGPSSVFSLTLLPLLLIYCPLPP